MVFGSSSVDHNSEENRPGTPVSHPTRWDRLTARLANNRHDDIRCSSPISSGALSSLVNCYHVPMLLQKLPRRFDYRSIFTTPVSYWILFTVVTEQPWNLNAMLYDNYPPRSWSLFEGNHKALFI
ncbi:putative acyl-CoA synthetase YngI [Fusarium oxysporum f. sp. albedinis]|nr:putative acyl-CoA synthetase YngI [Fusarium oxysporum f. sp. albedinis]